MMLTCLYKYLVVPMVGSFAQRQQLQCGRSESFALVVARFDNKEKMANGSCIERNEMDLWA
jgi:hypothetical protein